MKIHAISNSCAAFSLPLNELVGEDDMEKLCRRIIENHKLKPWPGMNIDVFTNSDTALCLAYPAKCGKIHIAPYALPYLKEYFTE